MNIRDLRRQRLQQLLEKLGQERGAQAKLARIVGKASAQISMWLNGTRSIDEQSARDMELHAGLPERWFDALLPHGGPLHEPDPPQYWTDQHHPSEGPDLRGRGTPVAQDLIHLSNTIDPITIAWESILATPLPARFRVRVPDDAMVLDDPPSMRTGDWAEFVPATGAQPNQVVLLRDRDGNVYIRRYMLRRPGHWVAVARHSGYAPMDSQADGLEVLALQVGAGWG